MSTCTAQPISWLKLEQYQLGELSADEQRRIEAHLKECEVCRASLDSIRADETVPAPQAAPKTEPLPEVTRKVPWLRWATAGAALAAAAALLLVLLVSDWKRAEPDIPGSKIGFKGGELSLSLVRECQGKILHDPESFTPGDRFKLQVTCPPAEELFWNVVVFQDDGSSFPYIPEEPLACGNRVPLPGAFSITGKSAAVVCLVVSSQPLVRVSLSLDKLPADTVCTILRSSQ
jgi:hypothetical protein